MNINGYVFELKSNHDWIGAPSEEWEIEVGSYETTKRLGNRSIDGASVEVYLTDDKVIAITRTMGRMSPGHF
jgi:hypothetical protein